MRSPSGAMAHSTPTTPSAQNATGIPPAGVEISRRSAATCHDPISVTSHAAMMMLVSEVDHGSAQATPPARNPAYHSNLARPKSLAMIEFAGQAILLPTCAPPAADRLHVSSQLQSWNSDNAPQMI